MIHVECSQCGARWTVEDASAGEQVRCGQCGLTFGAPDARADQGGAPASRSGLPDLPPTPKKATSATLAAHGCWFGVVAVLVAVVSMPTVGGILLALGLSLAGLSCSVVALARAVMEKARKRWPLVGLVLNGLFLVLLPFLPVLIWFWRDLWR